MAGNRWYEGGGDMEIGGGYEDSGGGGVWQETQGSTRDTLEAGNELLANQVEAPGDGGEREPPGGGGGGGDAGGGGGGGGGGKTWNWTPDRNSAQRAWEHAGKPAPPAGANFDEWVVAWFKNAVEGGAYLETGESSSETAYEKSGFSRPGAPDITGMRAYAKQHGMSEDFDRWSEGQLMAWEKDKDPSCPPRTPYRSHHGSKGCVEKPIDSVEGEAPSYGGGGGGGGRGGGRGGQGGGAGGGQASGVQPRADYNLQSNYLTQRGVGAGYGPGSNIGAVNPAPRIQTPQVAAQASPAVTNPGQFQLNQQQQQIAPGAQTIPTLQNGALWSTGW